MIQSPLMKELELRRSYMDNLPFCPDHRDKVKGKPCRECEVEQLRSAIEQVIRHHDQGTLAKPGDSLAIERLRKLLQ